ncbi:hypothetical protein E2C01_060812 [Portunus trituberculatus]|uniref:Uncharacterized protein n=1 Tax=Portunus trituberculatus TaxID=210409 RepID=A0A5B7H279_PORTR|nr:hypothetical protein [Portunus trituberculatus]
MEEAANGVYLLANEGVIVGIIFLLQVLPTASLPLPLLLLLLLLLFLLPLLSARRPASHKNADGLR